MAAANAGHVPSLRRRPLDARGRRPAPRALRDRLRGLLRLQRHRRQLARAGLAVPAATTPSSATRPPTSRPTSAAPPSSSPTAPRSSPSPGSTARSTPAARRAGWSAAHRHPLPQAAGGEPHPGHRARHRLLARRAEGHLAPGPSARPAHPHGRRPLRQRRGRRWAARPSEITWQAGVDVLCFGGTKNGMAVGEAVVFFDRAPGPRVRLPVQAGRPARLQDALPGRALGGHAARTAPGSATPGHANAMAALLHAPASRPSPASRCCYPRQANSVFVEPAAGRPRRPARARLALLRLHRLGRGAAHVLLGHHRGGRRGPGRFAAAAPDLVQAAAKKPSVP